MKKYLLFLVATFLFFQGFSQSETEKLNTISVGLFGYDGAGVYIMYERESDKLGDNESYFLRGIIGSQDVGYWEGLTRHDIASRSVSVGLGYRSYFSKTQTMRGFFSSNEFVWYQSEWDDSRFSGTYSYVSFFAPELGYKLGLGKNKNINIELLVGTIWKIEIKGKGDVDNKNFENWAGKLGFGLGYTF